MKQNWLFGLVWSYRVRKGVFDSTKIKKKLLIVTSFVSTVLLSCSVGNEYNFKNAEDVISKYQSYASELHEKSSCTTDELIDEICHWLDLSDTAYNYITKEFLAWCPSVYYFESVNNQCVVNLVIFTEYHYKNSNFTFLRLCKISSARETLVTFSWFVYKSWHILALTCQNELNGKYIVKI